MHREVKPKKEDDEETQEETKTIQGKNNKKFRFKKEKDDYEVNLTLNENKLKIEITQAMEPFYWLGEFTLKNLIAIDENWMSLLKEEIIFKYILMCFNNHAVTITETDDTGLKLEFKYQLGCDQVLLPMLVKREKMDAELMAIRQRSLFEDLVQEREKIREKLKEDLREELKKELDEKLEEKLKNLVKQGREEVKGGAHDAFVLIRENGTGSTSTYNPSFTDLSGTTTGELIIRRKSKVKWNLYIGGLYVTSGGGDYTSKFRIELTNENTGAIQYWPNANGCKNYIYNAGKNNIGSTFSFGDIAEIDEAQYTARLQWAWAYTYNSDSHKIAFYPTHGEARVLVDIYQ